MLGRATLGVRIMRPNDGAKGISAALTEAEEDDDDVPEQDNAENAADEAVKTEKSE